MELKQRAILILLVLAFGFSACSEDPFVIKLQPGSETCLESLLFVSGNNVQALPMLKKLEPVSLGYLQPEANKMENLRKGIKNRKYVLHHYKRSEGFDLAIPPVKFPLFWEIDSTHIQTEGTYLIDIVSESEVKIRFKCEGCAQIDQKGEKLAGKHAALEIEFGTAPDATIVKEDWGFRLRPRKIPFSEVVGQHFVLKVTAPETYCEAAKTKLTFENTKGGLPNSFQMRFVDDSEYWTSIFLKEIGIAIAMRDLEDARDLIQVKIDSLGTEIDALKSQVSQQTLERVLDALPNRAEKMQEFNAEENALMKLLEEKASLQLKSASMLPRILVLASGSKCD